MATDLKPRPHDIAQELLEDVIQAVNSGHTEVMLRTSVRCGRLSIKVEPVPEASLRKPRGELDTIAKVFVL